MSRALDKWIHEDVMDGDEDAKDIPEYSTRMDLAMIAARRIEWPYSYVSLQPGESSGLYMVGKSTFGGVEAIVRHEDPATAICLAIFIHEKGINWEEPDEDS